MTDRATSVPIVRSIVEFGVIERWLQHAGWKVDVVFLWVVVGVHRRWRHVPLAVIDRLSDLGDVAAMLKHGGVLQVSKEVIRCDLDRAVVATYPDNRSCFGFRAAW